MLSRACMEEPETLATQPTQLCIVMATGAASAMLRANCAHACAPVPAAMRVGTNLRSSSWTQSRRRARARAQLRRSTFRAPSTTGSAGRAHAAPRFKRIQAALRAKCVRGVPRCAFCRV